MPCLTTACKRPPIAYAPASLWLLAAPDAQRSASLSHSIGFLLMKPKAFLEITIASYLTARPSRDLITAANQQMTHDWWED